MAVTIRGTVQTNTQTASATLSLSLTGAQQPNAGDVLYIVHQNDFWLASSMPTPTVGGSTTGVVSVASADGGSDAAHIKSYRFTVGSTGDLTVAVTETGSADEEKLLAVFVLVGVDTTTPLDGTPAGATGAGTSHTAPSITDVATSDAYMICNANSGGGVSAGAYTPPGGMTEQYDVLVGGAMSTTGATQQLAASGATGTRVFTAASSGWAATSAAFRTASAGAATVVRQPLVVPSLAAIQAGSW